MNCAIHTDVPATAYCRTCGKPLCDTCKRDVRGVIYCEDCLAAQVQHTIPVVPATVPVVHSAPSPALATVIAIFFPFGLGAIYNGQYAKGLFHMGVFGMLIVAISNTHGGAEPLFGLALTFFYFYQIIDAYRTAKARQLGTPAPDPFGINQWLTGSSEGRGFGARGEGERQLPIGAIVLIGLGVLFLLDNLNMLDMGRVFRLWPLFLIGIGVWLLMRRRQATGSVQ